MAFLAGILTPMFLFSLRAPNGAPLYIFGFYAVIMIINSFFEFGMDVIETSMLGKPRPPVFATNLFMIIGGRGRFLKQLLMLLFFVGLIIELFKFDFDYAGLFFTGFLITVFPASLAVNSLYEDALQIMNPVILFGFIKIIDPLYFFAVLALAILCTGFFLAFRVNLIVLLVFLPFGLYGWVLFFRWFGLLTCERQSALFPGSNSLEREIATDRRIDQHFEDNADLHTLVDKAYWSSKNQPIAEAIKILDPLIKLGDWARFDAIFEMISGWPNKRAATHFIGLYVPRLLEKQQEMRAHFLCAWSLKDDRDFTLNNGLAIEQLAAASASKEQFIVSIRLLENFVEANPGHESNRKYLTLAADICQSRVNHEGKFKELQEKLAQL